MTKKRVYKTNRGAVVDMEALRASNEKTVAAGNMRVNAKGDVIKGGKVVKSSKQRVEAYYKTKKVQTAKTSIKTPVKKTDDPTHKIKTATPPKAPPVVEQQVEEAIEPVVTLRTRSNGSKYKEYVYPDGNIEIEEVLPPKNKPGV